MPGTSLFTRQRVLLLALVSLAALALLAAWMIDRMGIAPRSLGPYLERRAQGHHPLVEGLGQRIGRALVALDRGEPMSFALPPLAIGAQGSVHPPAAIAGKRNNASDERTVLVDSAAAARTAIEHAQPGDVITFLPGTYYFDSHALRAGEAGTAAKPITVRAQQPGSATLRFAITEGFRVSKPYWIFENLTIQGVCSEHANCEHAFHVVSDASHFIARNNVVSDFNAHFKINGEGGKYPDHGLIAANTLTNTSVRLTNKPVTPIDMVGASNWLIEGNLITDFIKGDGNRVSYGAFAKGAGSGNRFQQNIVLCEHRLRGLPGQRVGLSFGGGGTGTPFCRDRRCITEHDGGIIENNLIAFCSDDGIYLNRASTARVAHNTLLDTAGITVRFAVSSADIEGNLVDGIIRSRDDGVARATDNLAGSMVLSYLGLHPVRDLFQQTQFLDLAWRKKPPVRNAGSLAPGVDLCNEKRPSLTAYGAFADFAACLKGRGAVQDDSAEQALPFVATRS